jgi:hypothetical protein
MDDAAINISVSPDGFVQLRVEGELVGFLSEVCIHPLTHPGPNVRVKFINTDTLPAGAEKDALLEKMHYFRELLGHCSQVIVIDEVETLPYMMAVRPSSIPPAEVKDG